MRQTNASQYLLVVTFLAVFFINPLSFYGPGAVLPLAGQHSGSARSLSSFDMVEGSTSPISALMWVGVWALRLFVAALCFGWMMLKSMPKVMANSNDSVQFWRLRKQAEKDLHKVRWSDHYAPCRDHAIFVMAFFHGVCGDTFS